MYDRNSPHKIRHAGIKQTGGVLTWTVVLMLVGGLGLAIFNGLNGLLTGQSQFSVFWLVTFVAGGGFLVFISSLITRGLIESILITIIGVNQWLEERGQTPVTAEDDDN